MSKRNKIETPGPGSLAFEGHAPKVTVRIPEAYARAQTEAAVKAALSEEKRKAQRAAAAKRLKIKPSDYDAKVKPGQKDKVLASLLGVSPSTLSRYKAKRAKKI